MRLDCVGRRGKNVLQEDVHQIDAPFANFPTATARLMFQTQAMLFDFQKLFVNRKDLGRPLFPGSAELFFSVGQNFIQMRAAHTMSIRGNLGSLIQKTSAAIKGRSRIVSFCCRALGAGSQEAARPFSCCRGTERELEELWPVLRRRGSARLH